MPPVENDLRVELGGGRMSVSFASIQGLLGMPGQLNQIYKELTHLMSKVTEFASKQQADFDTLNSKVDSIAAGVTALYELIAAFQNSPGTLSPEDQAALDGIQAASAALVAKTAAINTAPPVAPEV
jgi:hypothetical protein